MKRLLLLLILFVEAGCRNLHSPVLITPSYGILNSADIKAYELMGYNTPFNTMKDSGLQAYWQCFKTPKIDIQCTPLGYIEEWASMGCDLHMIVETNDQKKHIYWLRRGMPIDYYHEKKILWHNITHNQEYVCFGGHHSAPDVANDHIVTSNWVYDKIKTKKGKDSYWVESTEEEKTQKAAFDSDVKNIPTISITEFKNNLSSSLDAAKENPVAILDHDVTVAYLVPADLYERMLDVIEELELKQLSMLILANK